MTLLSDAAFKVFVWLCLHADRGTGTLRAQPGEIARALNKSSTDLDAIFTDLFQKGICRRTADGCIEITDSFWPYQRPPHSACDEELAAYIAQVKTCFLGRRCVRGTFTPADDKLAAQFYRNGVSLAEVQHAILLGSLRKYAALINNGRGTPITSLHYFTSLIDEVRQEISINYWTYVAHKVRTVEQSWSGFTAPAQHETK